MNRLGEPSKTRPIFFIITIILVVLCLIFLINYLYPGKFQGTELSFEYTPPKVIEKPAQNIIINPVLVPATTMEPKQPLVISQRELATDQQREPIVHPQVSPTLIPDIVTRQAVTQTSLPVSTPTTLPVSTPTTLPVSTPTSQPAMTPSVVARQAVTPKSQTVSAPKSQTVSAPKSQSVSVPKSQTVSAPKSQPDSTPTSQPDSTPTSQPDSTPTSQPDSTPTPAPTLAPAIEARQPATPMSQPASVPMRSQDSQSIPTTSVSEVFETRPKPPCPSGWWQNENECLQSCVNNTQVRNSDGTCICNNGEPNQNCHSLFSCVQNSCKRLVSQIPSSPTQESQRTPVPESQETLVPASQGTPTSSSIPRLFLRSGGSDWKQRIINNDLSDTNKQSWSPDNQWENPNIVPSNEIANQFRYFAEFWLNKNNITNGSTSVFSPNNNGIYTFSKNPDGSYIGKFKGKSVTWFPNANSTSNFSMPTTQSNFGRPWR